MKIIALLLLTFLIFPKAQALPTKASIHGMLKKNYEHIRKNPAKLAKFMDSKSAKQYQEHLKKNKITELPKIDILDSGIYVPSLKLKLEYVETNVRTATMTWKLNGKELQWGFRDSFETHMKLYRNVLGKKVSWFEWIIPSANAMEMPYTLEGTLLENIMTTGWFSSTPTYAESDDATEYICDTATQETSLGTRSSSQAVTEVQWLTHIQEKYRGDLVFCSRLTGGADCDLSTGSNTLAALTNCSGEIRDAYDKCQNAKKIQGCLNKLVESRYSLIVKDISYDDIKKECFFTKENGVDIVNPKLANVGLTEMSAISTGLREDANLRKNVAQSVQQRCYSSSTPQKPASAGSQ